MSQCFTKCRNNIEFHYYIWNHHGNAFISTNISGIGLGICEMFKNFEKQNNFVWMVKPMAAQDKMKMHIMDTE